MRPKHYIKNGLIFLPLLFSRNFLNQQLLKTTIYGFIICSLAASIIYIFNDILDAEKDKKHPTLNELDNPF
jgi:4-hydroxybenzoate polyprenyltransferase